LYSIERITKILFLKPEGKAKSGNQSGSGKNKTSWTKTSTQLVHYKTNSRIIRRIIRFGLVVEYHPDYQVNYQPD